MIGRCGKLFSGHHLALRSAFTAQRFKSVRIGCASGFFGDTQVSGENKTKRKMYTYLQRSLLNKLLSLSPNLFCIIIVFVHILQTSDHVMW